MKKNLLLSLLAPLLLFFLHPFGMDATQSALFAVLVLTIIWWVQGPIPRLPASLFLLIVFAIWGRTPLRQVFQFPLSANFPLILFSFLFSQGIANSGLLEKLLQPLLFRFCKRPWQLVLSMILFSFVMIFVIPQSIPRVILLTLIYNSFLSRLPLEDEVRSILLFGVCAVSVSVNMILLRGDIVLNNALGGFSGIAISEGVWAKYMAVPTIILTFLGAILYLWRFRRELKKFRPSTAIPPREPLDHKERRHLLLLAALLLLWAAEPLHQISGNLIVVLGCGCMVGMGLLRRQDLKAVNVDLLFFLTASYSIGAVMKGSGVAALLFDRFIPLLPDRYSLVYVLVILAVSVLLHIVLGSNTTTLSVIVPGLMTIAAGVADPMILLFTIFVAVCAHYIFPFHSIVILVGEGKHYFSDKIVVRYGVPLTFLVIAAILVLYMGWWKFLGLM